MARIPFFPQAFGIPELTPEPFKQLDGWIHPRLPKLEAHDSPPESESNRERDAAMLSARFVQSCRAVFYGIVVPLPCCGERGSCAAVGH